LPQVLKESIYIKSELDDSFFALSMMFSKCADREIVSLHGSLTNLRHLLTKGDVCVVCYSYRKPLSGIKGHSGGGPKTVP
jgi:hypothetical protein